MSLPLILFFILPVLAVLLFMLQDAASLSAWGALLAHPQLAKGLWLSVLTGGLATLIAIFVSVLIVSCTFESGRLSRLSRGVGAMLAVPHLAFAIGFSFVIMPSGLLARLLAPLFGWASPPAWVTTHDPYGLALVAALAGKECGFLIFALLGILAREDVRQSFAAQHAVAQSLGHGSLSIWVRLLLPQLVKQMVWPVVIVFFYATSVVDMALVLGPTQPPTFALVVWSDLNSASLVDNARGGAGALLLALVSGAVALIGFGFAKLMRASFMRYATRGPSLRALPMWLGAAKWRGLKLFYLLSFVVLVLLSLAPLWPFPNLLPPTWDGAAWGQVMARPDALIASFVLAGLSSMIAIILLISWFEARPAREDRLVLVLSLALLGLPAVLTGLGQYRLLLRLDLVATGPGLLLAHLLPTTAYMFIMLRGPYRAFDQRLHNAAQGLGASRASFLFRVKWALLKAPIAAAMAVGFAVSFAQYVPAQLISAGRFTTLPIEAVTLASGGNRSLTAAFALLLMLPPLLAFGIAALASRPRWRMP